MARLFPSTGRSCALAAVPFALFYLFSCAQLTARPERETNRAPSSWQTSLACPVPANKGDPRLHARNPGFSYCGQFIGPDCRAGALGTAMQALFEPTGLATFVKDPPSDVLGMCPAHSTFDPDLRERFWIWTMMSIAYEEGGCGEPSVVQAVRDYYGKYKGTKLASAVAADGTYALPWSASERKARPEFCRDERIAEDADRLGEITYPGETGAKPGALGPSKIAGPVAGARCAMQMLAGQLRKSGKLMDPKSYWQKLRRPGTLSARLSKFGPCAAQ